MNRGTLVLLALLLTACRAGPEPAAATDAATRPERLSAQVAVEGMPQVLPLYLYRPPQGFPLEFSTYRPAELQPVATPDARRLRLSAAFGGRANPRAGLEIVALAGLDAGAARARVAALAARLDAAPVNPRQAWAVAEYRLGGGRAGFLALAVHEGKWFYVLADYPAEFGDGMAPRIALILEHWRWSNGAPLGGP